MSDDDGLGAKWRDKVTGFEGVATAVTHYINSANYQYRLTRADKSGLPEDVWIPVGRLERINSATVMGFA